MVRSIDIEKILEFGTRYVANKQAADLEDEVLDRLTLPNIFGKQAMLKMGESSGQPSGGQPGGKGNPAAGGGGPDAGAGQSGAEAGGEGSTGTGDKGPAEGTAQGGVGSEGQGGTSGSPGTGTGAAGTDTGTPETGTGAPGPLPGSDAPLTQEQIEYNTERSGLQTVPGAKTPPYDATDPEGQSEIKGSPVERSVILKKIKDSQEYRSKKDDGGFQADANLLKEAVKNRDNNQWLQQNKDKVNGALERVFEYGALQWATEGFQITDPALIRSRVQKLYDVALRNERLDARDLDLVYSRFTRQLGLPDREVLTDPESRYRVTIKNPTTFQMFQNWMNSPEVPWWHKAALIIGVPLAFAGLVTKLAGGSTEASLLLGGSGVLLSGLGGLFAYTGARDLESKRLIEQAAKLKKLRIEQAKYDALESTYSRFGPKGKDFVGQFFNQKDGKPLIPDAKDILPGGRFTTQAVEKFLNLADTPEKRAEAERILFTLDALHKFEPVREGKYVPEVKLTSKINALQMGTDISFEEISRDFRDLLGVLPSDMKGQILGEMGYDPAAIQMFKYLENLGSRDKEDVYNAGKKSGPILTDLILGEASPEELLQSIDQTDRNIIIRDATIRPRWELERTPNRNLGVLMAKDSWVWEDSYNKEVIMPSIINAMKDSEVTYSDLAFLNSLAMGAKYVPPIGLAERPPQTPAENKEQAQARLAGDILNSSLIPPSNFFTDKNTINAIYGEVSPYLSVPGNSLKTFIQIARDNMDYVLEDNTHKSLAGLMVLDLYRDPVRSYSAAYIDDVVNSSVIPYARKGIVANELKQLAIKDPTAAVLALGLFNPMIREQMADPDLQPKISRTTRRLADDTINRIKSIAGL